MSIARVEIVLNTRRDKEVAKLLIDRAQRIGTRVEIKEPQRTLPQNNRFWAMLTDVSRQKKIEGRKYTPDQWKVIFLHAWAREVAKELQYLPSVNGPGLIPYGNSSSDLSVKEMAEVITWMEAWGAENGILWSDPTTEEMRATR